MTSLSETHSDPPRHLSWYHPRALAWFTVEIIHLLRAYCREKYASLKAERWALELQVANSMRNTASIARDEDLPLMRRQQAVRTLAQLTDLAEELDIDDQPNIKRCIEEYRELEKLRHY